MKMLNNFSDNKYEFLSNFYACQVFYKNDIDPEGYVYPTVEHAFQAAKATTVQGMRWVAAAPTPGEAKKRGRAIKLRWDWETIKDDVMLTLIRTKFKNADMCDRMLRTVADGIDAFCEGNWWHDNYWGDCNCPKCQNIFGQNRLGKILTKVRQEIITDILERKNEDDECSEN